jgi:hypothetical protein
MVYLLREVAEAEAFFGNNQLAQSRLDLAQAISNAVNEYLWSTSENDHYVIHPPFIIAFALLMVQLR